MADRKATQQGAEAIAIEALGFLANDPALLPRFLAITGIEVGAIREAAMEPGFLAGVLGFITAHEPTLMLFSQACGIAPSAIAAAQHALPLGDDRHEAST